MTAVRTLAAASGVKLATPAAPATPSHGISRRQAAEIALIVIASLAVCDVLYRLTRRFGPRLARQWRPWLASLPQRLRRPVVGISVAGFLVLAVTAGIAIHAVTGPPAAARASRKAPCSRRTRTSTREVPVGRRARLHAHRPVRPAGVAQLLPGQGRDPGVHRLGVHGVCPLTTTALLDAKTMLGAAGARSSCSASTPTRRRPRSGRAVLLAAARDALPVALPDRVARRSCRACGRPTAGGVTVSQNQIDHEPAVFVITPEGKLAKLYLTQLAYSAVGAARAAARR